MMRALVLVFTACVLPSLIARMATVGAGAAQPSALEAMPGATLQVLRTREVRQSFEPGVTIQSPRVFSDDGPKVGNWLMFDLAFEGMPDSSRVMSVELVSASAQDDLGSNLIEPVVKATGGDAKKLQERSVLMHDAAPSIRWFVAAPPRKASTVEGSLIVQAKIAAKRDTLVIKPTQAWQKLDHPSVSGLNAEFRWSRMGGLGPFLEVRPRSVEPYIYSLSPRPPQFSGRAHCSSADSTGMFFLLANETPEGAEITIKIYADVKQVEATLTMKGHVLPN